MDRTEPRLNRGFLRRPDGSVEVLHQVPQNTPGEAVILADVGGPITFLGANVLDMVFDSLDDVFARVTQAQEWVAANCDPIPSDEGTDRMHEAVDALQAANQTKLTAGQMLDEVWRFCWERFGLVPYPELINDSSQRSRLIVPASLGRPRVEPPLWFLELYGLVRKTSEISKAIAPSIAPAFLHDNRTGLGRISSSQISQCLFEACIAPKEEWDQTAKGFPCYRSRHGETEITYTLRPDVVDPKNIAAEVEAMRQIRNEITVRDWDVLVAMMAQVLSEGRPDASAYIRADTILDYRHLERKTGKDGYSAGHHTDDRVAVADSVRRLSYLRVATETLKIREYGPNKSIRSTMVDWNEKILTLEGDAVRRDDDTTLAWRYSFGRWFTTFLRKPNRFIAYMFERPLAYNPYTQQWTKQLAYYLTLEMRKNADNGQALARCAGELLNGAKIPTDERFPNRAKDRLEGAIRDLIKDGLFRVEHNGQLLDSSSDDIDDWTAADPARLPARKWFGAYRKQGIVFRADPETEERYDREIRRRAASSRKARATPRATTLDSEAQT